MIIPIENIDGAFAIDDMLCIKSGAIENSPTPKLLELIQLWSQHGERLSLELHHLYNKDLLPQTATVELHENYGWGHWTIWVDVPDWYRGGPDSGRISLYQLQDDEERRFGKKRKPEPERVLAPGYIYLLRSENNRYKIGRAKDLEARVHQIEREYPIRIKLIHSFAVADTPSAERTFHNLFRERRLDNTEWFELTQDDIERFIEQGGNYVKLRS